MATIAPPKDNKLNADSSTLTGAFAQETDYEHGFYEKKLNADMPRGAEDASKQGVQSLFNAWNLFAAPQLPDGKTVYFDQDLQGLQYLTPTAANIINNPIGASTYDWQDFAYCRFLGQIPNNRLITLRRFAEPCQDDIFNTTVQQTPEIAHMITWFDGENNKLEDLLSFSFGMRWKELSAALEQGEMRGDSGGNYGISGWMGRVAKLMDPVYAKDQMRGKARLSIDPTHDHNKVYGPIDSITQTHIRDVGLNFEHELTVKFFYSLKSIDGINPKTAMLDLLSNVMQCTYNDAKFWGGGRYWVGGQPSIFWNKALELESAVIQDALDGSFNSITDFFKGIAQNIMNASGGGKEAAKQKLQQIAKLAFQRFAVAKFLNTIGRPAIPVMNSLLKGDAIGEWHLLLGNPLRPIACIGNLILTKTDIQPASSELGYDDFPTDFIVTCHLKHAMPRDRSGVESMILSTGFGRTYWKPSDSDKTSLGIKGGRTSRTRHNFYDYTDAAISKVYDNVYAFVQSADAKKNVDKLNEMV
jgi:hypothetical protein